MAILDNDLYLEAYRAREARDFRRMLTLLRRGVEASDERCMFDLAYAYDVGLGLVPDMAEALGWYRRVYRKRGPQAASAASNIAVLYREHGRPRMAFEWWVRAVALGDGDAQVEVAKRYSEGKGVRRNESDARKHLRMAITSSHITEAGREEAVELLRTLGRKP